MDLRHKNKHPPSEYEKGGKVMVKITKSDKKNQRQRKNICYEQEVVQRSGNRYQVENEVGQCTRYAWFSVLMITSATRAEEIKRQAKAKRNAARESLLTK